MHSIENINVLEVSDISDFRADKVHFLDWYKDFSLLSTLTLSIQRGVTREYRKNTELNHCTTHDGRGSQMI